ncbi:hypothetical protein DFJ58DRAFT_657271 [Suillus subalutaceus]|uniref:uncharacterized protein n=1 Tax=Suillus subalutaceus TaxID=48586 RepID=UPI001B879815|nr:uncharacterized protein DFJ58DRAFT_657271 [Suillus subalutaceus]KAG1861781.1 hypothetical protein DFJ58DRAFT_657271 [Suillus subalutaceus]
MSSSAQDLIPTLNIGNTFGALFIGVTIAAVLFGLSNVQAFVYFQAHRGTGTTFYKLAVRLYHHLILDAVHLALIVHCVYYYLVSNYANVNALTEIVWSFKVSSYSGPPCSPLHEVLIVSRYQCHVFSDLVKIQWATFLTLGTITFADVVVASSLCYLLAISRTGFSSTDSLITKLMVYIINTGCLTSICSMTAVITCAVMPTNFIFLAIEFLLAKCMAKTFS